MNGLTKREYFSAKAMQGIIAADILYSDPEQCAEYSLKFADALIRELNKMELNKDKENKRYEMIGELFMSLHIETAELIMSEFSISKPEKIAAEVEEIFPKKFLEIATASSDEFNDWCDEYDAKCDPPMDESNYLKREI